MTVVRNNNSGAVQLTPNFYLSEFTDSDKATRAGIANSPDPLAITNLFKMATLMEQVRKLLGNKVISISSGFRSTDVNKLVGGSATSDHLTGSACDFVCRGFGTPLQVAQAISKSGLKWGQLIFEGTWVHLSLPRGDARDGQVLTAIFEKGKTTRYIAGIQA